MARIVDNYSLEARAASIFDRRSREYFLEVLSSYRQGNYRSATTMLWSVAVCDLLYKLKFLSDMYGDTIAKEILEEVQTAQENNTRSSDWEFRLIERVEERTRLLELADLDHLRHLQQQRHLAAHPVLSKDLELHQPNKDTVRALIRNTLDGLLTKPPIYTRRVFDEFVRDIAESAAALVTDDKLRAYLEAKYLTRADQRLEHDLIRSLWKLVFRLSNHDCDLNRGINFRALLLLVERNRREIKSIIANEPDYYSSIAPTGAPVVFLVRLLSRYPEVYDELNGAAKVVLQHIAEEDPEAKALAWFLTDSIEEHAASLIEWIESDAHPTLSHETLIELRALSDSEEWEAQIRRIYNSYYGASWSFDEADQRFDVAISPFVEEYKDADLRDLIEKIERNGQTYDRRAARRDHRMIYERCEEVGFDASRYQRFLRAIE